eukprot:11890420-Karenia_brevis.AAC.1
MADQGLIPVQSLKRVAITTLGEILIREIEFFLTVLEHTFKIWVLGDERGYGAKGGMKGGTRGQNKSNRGVITKSHSMHTVRA